MKQRLCLAFTLACLAPLLPAAPSLELAISLYQERKYPDARAALEQIVAVDPNNAAACYYLGMTLSRRSDSKALDDAAAWLEKAIQLEPNNATYLADYGGISLLLANKNWSLAAANKGREAMEKSLAINPDNLDAREGLYEFYSRAPWPLGSSSKAQAQLNEISKRDPNRGLVISVSAKTKAKDYASAFKICDDLLARQPDNYAAHYQYGRTASVCGQNLEAGLAHLQKCLSLTPPSPAAPSHSAVWNRIGNVQEKLGRTDDARTAYENALRLDASNKQAAEGLARVKR